MVLIWINPQGQIGNLELARIGKLRGPLGNQGGAVALEFALCLIPLLLLLGGIYDFGGLLYMKLVLTSAGREGARYATLIQTDSSGNPIAPNNLNPSVSDYVLTSGFGLQSILPGDANPTVTCGGSGYTAVTPGLPVSVQVTAQWHWVFLNILPGLPNPQTVSSTTVMAHQ